MIDVFDAKKVAHDVAIDYLEDNNKDSCFVAVSSKKGIGIACSNSIDAVNCDCKFVFQCYRSKTGDSVVKTYLYHAY